MGFASVYDYAAGKADWAAAGLPREGATSVGPTAADAARPDVPTCRLDDPLDQVRPRLESTDWSVCVVVNRAGVVLGRVSRGSLGEEDARTVEEAMREGPGTVRPKAALAPLVDRLRERSVATVIVTRSYGKLVGVIRVDEADELLRSGSPSAGG